MTWSELVQREWFGNVVSTIVVLIGIALLRRLAVRAILRRQTEPPEVLRSWVIDTRNLAIAIAFFGVVLIWGPELRAFALSLAAFAVALVIAAKELILNISGGIYRLGIRALAVGERIEVGGVRGDVIDKSLASTTILEVGPSHDGHRYTGRAVVVPNSVLLSSPVYSETFSEQYGFHQFRVPLKTTDDWKQAEKRLLETAREVCTPYQAQAQAHIDSLRRAHGLPALSVEPQIDILLPEPGRIDLLVRVPVPLRKSGSIEQAILRGWLSHFEPAS